MTSARIADYLAKWALEPDGAPFETMSSDLCYVRRGETRAVLKIHKPESDEHDAALTLSDRDDEATEIWCDVVAALHITSAQGALSAVWSAQGRGDDAKLRDVLATAATAEALLSA